MDIIALKGTNRLRYALRERTENVRQRKGSRQMKTYSRYSTAMAAAGDRPILCVRCDGKSLYIVGDLEPLDSIELISQPRVRRHCTTPQRNIAGQIILGHLDRLGNANGAAAAEYNRDRRVWKDRWGMKETFINPDHKAQCDADKAARPAPGDFHTTRIA